MLDRAPIEKIVPDMPVKIQIVFQQKSVIRATFEAFFQCNVRASRLPFLVSNLVAVIHQQVQRSVAPVSPCQVFQCLLPYFASCRA